MTTLALLEQPEVLTDELARRGQPGYRADQIWRWIYQRRATEFHAMTDLPVHLRAELADRFTILTTRVIDRQRDPDGTWKLLLRLADDERIECVLLRDEQGHRTACVSTQVGCAIGCSFCATGLDGLRRNLARGEIVEQLLHLSAQLPEGERLTHVVVMGMGEPLANLPALLPALAVAADVRGLGVSVRRITISTVGLPDGIRRLAELDSPYHLAVSLHAADDALRDRLVPANRGIGVGALVAAADAFFRATGRRVTFEYVLLAGVNDQPHHARRLADLLRGRPALVNVIPYNPVPGLPFAPPRRAAVRRFVDVAEGAGLNVQLRHRRGATIDAACGQLRRQIASPPNP